ncbi:MAK10-like protein [Tanacetum coccineum]
MIGTSKKENLDRYCDYHGEKGHYTNDCYQLKRKLEAVLESRKLSHLIQDIRQSGGTRGRQQENNSGKGKIINMVWVRGDSRKRKHRRNQEEDWMNTPITFPLISADDVSDEPLIIKVKVEGYLVRRVFVDHGVIVQVMFEHCFDNLPSSVRACLTQTQTELVGFSGEQLIPMGKIELKVMFGSEGLCRRTMMKFTVHIVPNEKANKKESGGEKKLAEEDHLVNPAFLEQRVTIGTQFYPANTIELPEGNNEVPIRSDTIRLVQNGCSFHGLRSKDPNQHLKDFIKLVDSLDLNGSISTWEDLTTRFLAQFFPPGRTTKLHNNILMFQQHQEESFSKAWTHFKNLLQKVPHHGINLWLQLRDRNTEESWTLLEELALYDNESWNDPKDFAKPVKAISLPQDVPSTSDRRLIELENQVQRLMEAHLAPKQPVQVNKISSSCEICSGPHDTQYCMENPEQAFVDYASSRTDEAGGKWFTFKPEQNNLGDTYNPSWKSHPNLRWRQPQNSQNNFSNPPNRFQPNGSFPNRSFNNNPQNFNNQSNLKGLVSNFMASQDARLSKFEADFKQQQSEMTKKIDTVLKATTDQITGALPSDTVKNPKLNVNSTTPVLSTRSYPTGDPQCSSHPPNSINTIKTCSKETNHSQKDQLQIVMEIGTQ